jgi:hypothetical protein
MHVEYLIIDAASYVSIG